MYYLQECARESVRVQWMWECWPSLSLSDVKDIYRATWEKFLSVHDTTILHVTWFTKKMENNVAMESALGFLYQLTTVKVWKRQLPKCVPARMWMP